jgi:hypothetical protein
MKTFICIICACFCTGCSNDDLEKPQTVRYDHGYIIGFHPCDRFTGRVVTLLEQSDTVITYNLPDSIYDFPTAYFEEYKLKYLFPDSVLTAFPVTITYTHAQENERRYMLCVGDTWSAAPFVQAVDDRQVIIITISRN